MEVTKVTLTRNYEIGGVVCFENTTFYASEVSKQPGPTVSSVVDMASIYDSNGHFVGSIDCRWQDYAGGKLFVEVK